jgi:hypothetical protein
MNGFTHVGRLSYLDLTNGVLQTELRWPASGYAPTGAVLSAVGFFLTKPFATTGSSDSNLCTIAVGQWAARNAALGYHHIGSNPPISGTYTNPLLPSIVTAFTQAFVTTLTFTNVSVPATVTNGEVYIYYRILRPDRLWGAY